LFYLGVQTGYAAYSFGNKDLIPLLWQYGYKRKRTFCWWAYHFIVHFLGTGNPGNEQPVTGFFLLIFMGIR
jgi:hypothetical protein